MSDAYQEGLRLLSRRALTRREVVLRLRGRGHGDEDVEAAVCRLAAVSAIDDRALALHWIGSQAASRGRGRARALAELAARGVEDAVASSAWSQAVEDGAIDEDAVLARAVRRKLGAPPGRAGTGRLARVYNALLYEGFGRAQVEAALVHYGFERTES
jgi:SOS response regulatory protein OraA/RecX